jgi:hypothetical protein
MAVSRSPKKIEATMNEKTPTRATGATGELIAGSGNSYSIWSVKSSKTSLMMK